MALLTLAVAATLVFALAGTSVTHLHVASRTDNGDVARNLAESAIAYTLERVLMDEKFGESRLPTQTLTINGPISDSRAIVSFHEGTASQNLAGYSTNNLQRESAVPGNGGRVVPGSALHVVALAECRGTRRRMEAIFSVPRFPYVIATAGRFRSDGHLLVAGVESTADLVAQNGVRDEDLLPGHIVSNSVASDALQLGSQTKVTGDAQASGGVELGGATVLGEVRTQASPTEIPDIAISDFDPQANGKTGIQNLTTSVVNQATYEGWVRREGDLMITNGLKLDQGVLYVDGDLVVTGGVTGTGAIFVTGETSVSGRSDLSTDNQTALMSDGSILLDGAGESRSYFQGLIYTRGDFKASDITLVGTLMVKGTASEMVLKNANVVYTPESARLDLQMGARTAFNFVDPNGSNPGAFLGTGERNGGNHSTVYVTLNADGSLLIYPQNSDESSGFTAGSVDEAVQIFQRLLLEGEEKELQAFQNAIPRLSTILAEISDGTRPLEEEAVDLVTVDPSKFLRLQDKIRLVLMKEL